MLKKIASSWLDKEAKSFAAYGGEALGELWRYIQKTGITDKAINVPRRLRKKLATAVDAYRNNTKGVPLNKQRITPSGVIPNTHYEAHRKALDGYMKKGEVHHGSLVDNPAGGKLMVEGWTDYDYIPGRRNKFLDLERALKSKDVDMTYHPYGITFTGKHYKQRIPQYVADGYPSYNIGGKTIYSDEPRLKKLPFWHDYIETRQHPWSPNADTVEKTFSWDDFNTLLRQSNIVK